jgi:hypothetical protein
MVAMTGHHGFSSPDGKMGKAQDEDRGTSVERYQRAHGLWRELGTGAKQANKHRASKKRRANDRTAVKRGLDAN